MNSSATVGIGSNIKQSVSYSGGSGERKEELGERLNQKGRGTESAHTSGVTLRVLWEKTPGTGDGRLLSHMANKLLAVHGALVLVCADWLWQTCWRAAVAQYLLIRACGCNVGCNV